MLPEHPTSFLIYTLIASGHEILLVNSEGGVSGLIYHPQQAKDPVPWLDECDHCIAGKNTGLPLSVRQMVKLLATRKVVGGIVRYTVPANNDPIAIACEERPTGMSAVITRSSPEPHLGVVYDQGRKPTITGDLRKFQSPILQRCLKFLYTRRLPANSELRSLFLPLLARQKKQGIVKGNFYPCKKIDWRQKLNGSKT